MQLLANTPALAQVKLVVIDSITFHFRQNFPDLAHRARVLAGMAQKLMQLAVSLQVAVRVPTRSVCNRGGRQ